MSASIDIIAREHNTSKLILEINALRMMVQLRSIDPVISPANRGMTFLIYSLLKSTLEKFSAEKKINSIMSWFEIIEIVAKEIEIYTIFQKEGISQYLKASVRFIISYRREHLKIQPHQLHIDPALAIPFIHNKILSLLETESGICIHYASYAIYYLIQAGIRPVGSVWLSDKKLGHPIGHNIVIIGLQNQDDYANLAKMDALIFDYWNGGIFSTRNAFSSGGVLEQYDESKIRVVLHIKPDDVPPFPVLTPNLDLKKRLQQESSHVSQHFLSIIEDRIANGEKAEDVVSWISKIPDEKQKLACMDWDDSERRQNSRDVSERLMRYEQSAKIIQSAWRFFSSKQTQSSDAPLSHQPAQP